MIRIKDKTKHWYFIIFTTEKSFFESFRMRSDGRNQIDPRLILTLRIPVDQKIGNGGTISDSIRIVLSKRLLQSDHFVKIIFINQVFSQKSQALISRFRNSEQDAQSTQRGTSSFKIKTEKCSEEMFAVNNRNAKCSMQPRKCKIQPFKYNLRFQQLPGSRETIKPLVRQLPANIRTEQ